MVMLHRGIEIRIGIPLAGVEVDYLLQRLKMAIMHVWSGSSNVAQRGGKESAGVGGHLCFVVATYVAEVTRLGDPFAGVVELAIREQRVALAEGMTYRAIASAGVEKDSEASNLLGRQG